MNKFNIQTIQRYELVDITDKIEEIIKKENISDGIIVVFLPHSTAGLLLTENEPGLKEDWLNFFKKIVFGIDFLHDKIDDNADSHILAGLINQEKTLIVQDGNLVRGTWQQIFLAEFDGPRNRQVIVKTC